MTSDPWVTTQRLIAVLTAVHNGQAGTIGQMSVEWDREDLLLLAAQACGMLHAELTLAEDRTGVTVDEYLQLAGLAAARNLR